MSKYKVGGYVRLSRDDDYSESDSIQRQMDFIKIIANIELDCELLVAHKNYESADEKVKGNFFKLIPGLNKIDILGNYTRLEIVYRKAYL